MTEADNPKQKSWFRRAAEITVLVILPIIIIGVGVWLGGDVLAALGERIGQQVEYRSNRGDYAEQATQAAAAQQGASARTNAIALMGFNPPRQDPTPEPLFATNTPRPSVEFEIPQVNTAAPEPTEPPAQADATATIPLVETLVLPTIIFPEDPSAEQIANAPTAVPTRIPPITRNYDLVNIMLLGSDEEITQDNTIRTDTMIIVSINRETGTVNMMSLPRDMYVFIPGLGMGRLNVAFGWGENVGWTGGGFGLLRDTIIYNLGINIHYYAKVNITEFEQIVDLVGGVEVAVDCAYQDFYPVAPIEELDLTRPIEENYALRTLEVGYYTLDGFDAQWYARTRKNSSDFDRGRRQQKIVRAIFRQALDSGQLAELPRLWNEGIQYVETNLTLNEAISLLPIAINLNSSEVEAFTLIPTYHTTSWTPPDGSNVQLPNYETLIPFWEDFYTPPTANQIDVRGATIRVLNGTDNPDFDKVAADVLLDAGFSAFAAGAADDTDYADTLLVDYTGASKGSSSAEIADIINVGGEHITQQPDANRVADFDVIVGENFNACPGGVLPVEELEE
ncbi:MAG: LCP family protein [Chloroflexota bacterium]